MSSSRSTTLNVVSKIPKDWENVIVLEKVRIAVGAISTRTPVRSMFYWPSGVHCAMRVEQRGNGEERNDEKGGGLPVRMQIGDRK